MNTPLRDTGIRRDLSNVTTQIEGLLHKIGDEGKERLDTIRGRLSSAASDLSTMARDKYRVADENARKAAKATDEYVHENPWRTVGAAAVAGLALGYLVSRARTSRR